MLFLNLKKITVAFAICATLWGCQDHHETPHSTLVKAQQPTTFSPSTVFGRWRLIAIQITANNGTVVSVSETINHSDFFDLRRQLAFASLDINSDSITTSPESFRSTHYPHQWNQNVLTLPNDRGNLQFRLENDQLHIVGAATTLMVDSIDSELPLTLIYERVPSESPSEPNTRSRRVYEVHSAGEVHFADETPEASEIR